jgi:hypothetical protein
MSRCVCCNALLSDFEATRRHAMTKRFLEMCTECINVSFEGNIPTIDRFDLLHEYDLYDTYKEEDI